MTTCAICGRIIKRPAVHAQAHTDYERKQHEELQRLRAERSEPAAVNEPPKHIELPDDDPLKAFFTTNE